MRELSEIEEKNKKTNKHSLLFSVILVFFIILTFATPFLQVFFPVRSQAVIEATELYERVEKSRSDIEEKLTTLLIDFQSKKIDLDYLEAEVDKHIPILNKLEKESETLYLSLNQTKNKEKVFGFRTSKVFFANLGMPLVSVFLGFFLLFLFFKEEDLFFRKVIFAFSFVGMITGLFYLVWVFYPKGDLPESAYITIQLLLSTVGALTATIAGKYFFALSQIELKLKIQDLLSFISRDIKRKYISKQDRPEFISDYLGEIKKLSQK